jgi:hypothetical protein
MVARREEGRGDRDTVAAEDQGWAGVSRSRAMGV